MGNIKQIKSKIKSVDNLKKITRALEIVSTVKLQKTKDKADAMKKYLIDLLFILQNIGPKVDIFQEQREKTHRKLSIIITSEKGLCGSINSKLLKKVSTKLGEKRDNIFIIGKKGLEYFTRTGYNLVGTLSLKDNFEFEDLLPLFTYINEVLETKIYSKITLFFNYFKNTLIQIPTEIQIYPLNREKFDEFVKEIGIYYSLYSDIEKKELVIEPDIETLVLEIKRQIRNYLIISAIQQNKVGEHASRMFAMKNAKDNSISLIKQLVLTYNKARQSSITQEISEIVSAKIAIDVKN